MEVYFRCSWQSSNIGYCTGKYDFHNDMLVACEKGLVTDSMNIELGQSIMFGVNETGEFFTGIYGLGKREGIQYVNAVFTSNNNEEVLQAFSYFCRHYNIACKILKSSVLRNDNGDDYSFKIDKKSLERLLYNFKSEPKWKINRRIHKSSVVAFITQEKYNDYIQNLSRYFKYYESPIIVDNIKNMSIVENIGGKVITELQNQIDRKWIYIAGAVMIAAMVVCITIASISSCNKHPKKNHIFQSRISESYNIIELKV